MNLTTFQPSNWTAIVMKLLTQNRLSFPCFSMLVSEECENSKIAQELFDTV